MSYFGELLPPTFKDEVIQWLKDDCPKTDVGGFVVGSKTESATLYCKSSTVLAGVPFVNVVLEYCNLTVRWLIAEGMPIEVDSAGKVVVAVVSGDARNILLAERLSLNILSRASGVASASRRAVAIKQAKGWHGYVAGTRKTTPGFATVEKYALLVGGASTHRLDLSQMIMLKDNHIWSAGNITNAVHKARQAAGFSAKIEVECQSVEEALEACAAGAEIVMLDNFTSDRIGAAAQQVKDKYPHVLVEASGGITEETMGEFMHSSVDIISRGSLTQGYACADYSLKIDRHV